MTALLRIGAVSGVFTDPGSDPTYLDFTDADLLDLVADGDVLLLIAYGATLGTPGASWAQRWSSGSWKAWTRSAVAREAFPALEAADGSDDAAGVVLVYRPASPSYLVGGAGQRSTSSALAHATPAATVVDANGRLLALWLGRPLGPTHTALAAPVETVIDLQTSNASGSGARRWVVGEAPIEAVPAAGALTLSTTGSDSVQAAMVPLRDRAAPAPARLVDTGAGANVGLLP
jgi:hypothetical protein